MKLATKLAVLFGRASRASGLCWAAVVLLLVPATLARVAPREQPTYDRTAVGTVRDVERLSPGSDNHTYAVTAHYSDENGVVHTVRSFTNDPPSVDDLVEVKYQGDDPEQAVIAGHRTRRYVAESALLLPAISLVVALIMHWPRENARLALRLLPGGTIATGTVIAHEKDTTDENPVWRTRLSFTALDQTEQTCVVETTSEPPYKVGGTWPVIYDAGWPDHATPLAHLGGAPAITDGGDIVHQQSAWPTYVILASVATNALLFVGGLAIVRGWL